MAEFVSNLLWTLAAVAVVGLIVAVGAFFIALVIAIVRGINRRG